jgi:hypothetical protein
VIDDTLYDFLLYEYKKVIFFSLQLVCQNCIEINRGIYKAQDNGWHIMKVHTHAVISKETSAMDGNP